MGLALAAALHGALLLALVRAVVSVRVERPPGVVSVAIHAPTPRVRAPGTLRATATPAPTARSPRPAPPDAIPVQALPMASAGVQTPSPAPAASAASAPPDLVLTREQLRELESEASRRLATMGPHAVARSPYDRLAPDADGVITIELPHGVTEVHSHGGCYRLVPTPRAQSDPFNHAGERLSGPCLPGF